MGKKSRHWFGFGFFLLPEIYKVLYVLVSLGVIAGGVIALVLMWDELDLQMHILAIVGIIISPFVVRLLFELLILPFRIVEELMEIRFLLERSETSPGGSLRHQITPAQPMAQPPASELAQTKVSSRPPMPSTDSKPPEVFIPQQVPRPQESTQEGLEKVYRPPLARRPDVDG